MNKDNNFGRLLLLLLLAFGICLGLYYLPDQLFGMKIKKVDLLSDLRIKPESLSMASLRMQLEQPDTVRIDSAAVRDSILKTTGIDSVALALRDSLYKVMYADKGADSLGTRIEDYSVGHIGLKRFFAALRNSRQANRPVRVAFLGDSFIEGDIVVADFRSGMQERFGVPQLRLRDRDADHAPVLVRPLALEHRVEHFCGGFCPGPDVGHHLFRAFASAEAVTEVASCCMRSNRLFLNVFRDMRGTEFTEAGRYASLPAGERFLSLCDFCQLLWGAGGMDWICLTDGFSCGLGVCVVDSCQLGAACRCHLQTLL